ncbi:hypothetical protein K501DRAFT_293458 [Backusella circina FSU 941]|nr:hypothetical protein K501DRAFT_293458 [Backusella circina FSU 941]
MELIENDDPDWYLVKMKNGEIGLAPSNYVVDAATTGGQEEESLPPVATVAVPVVAQPPVQPIKSHLTGAPRELMLDEAQSWTVHEYDQAKKKKKKDKGNLLIGNGMICYGSETDKSLPVQQYSILEVTKYLIDGKNLHLEIQGSKNAVYDFQASSKSEAKAILAKMGESTKAAQLAGTHVNTSAQISTSAPSPPSPPSPQPVQHHVPPVVYSPPPAPEPEDPTPNCVPKWGISIYSFDAEGGEEMSVKENEQLYVVDYERTDGWWQVQKVDGDVGIIPSSYVQFDDEDDDTAASTNIDDIRRKREEEERELKNRRLAEEREREQQKRREQEERERRFAEENSRREEEARKREEENRHRQQEEERRRQVQEAAKRAEEERLRKVEEEYRRDDMERKASRSVSRTSTVSRSNTVSKSHQDLPKPDPTKIRTWTDRSGTFKVEAQFIDFHNGKLRLHKLNGVKIDVPVGKMCAEDVRWVDQQQRRISTPAPAPVVQESSVPILSRSNTTGQKKLNKRWDWFDWFMAIGIPMQASLQYASSFKAEKLDDSDISQLTHKQMKTLGLKEEHVRRVERFIETGISEDPEDEIKKKEQLEKDEEMARKLQNEWQNSESSPNTKPASRPRPPLSAPNAVHPDLLEFIGTQLGSSNSITTTSTPAPVQQQQQLALTPIPSAVKAKEPEAASQNSSRGFQDDAWTPRSDASPLPPAATPVKPMIPSQVTSPPPPLQPIQAAPTGPSPEEQLAIQKAEEERKRASEEQRKKLSEEEQIQKIQLMSLKKQAQEQQKQLEELQQLTKQQIGLQQQLAMQTGNQQKYQQQQQQMQQMQSQQLHLQQQLQQQTVLPQNMALQQQVQQQQQQLQNAPGRQRPTAPLRMATDPSLGQWQSNAMTQQQTGFQSTPMNVSQPPTQQPIQTGYQNNTMNMQQSAWRPQQLQSQITGFPSQPTGFNPAAPYQQPMATATVPVTSILPQPLVPTTAISRSQTLGSQPTGRHWNSATPDNPFGSPTPSNLAPQMTGVQFSTPNPQSFNPTVLQAQMTGQPSHSIFTPQGSMQYGQSAFPNNQRRW